jgi:hypothetical protein
MKAGATANAFADVHFEPAPESLRRGSRLERVRQSDPEILKANYGFLEFASQHLTTAYGLFCEAHPGYRP